MSRFLASALSLLLASSVAHGAPLNDRRSAPTQLNVSFTIDCFPSLFITPFSIFFPLDECDLHYGMG